MPDNLTYVQIDQIENQHQKYKLVDSTARASIETALTAINNILAGNSTPDTKNTAGATNNTNELYLIGATTQGENPQTYSNSTVYINNNNLYANNSKVLTLNDVNRTGPLNNTNNIVPSQQTVRSYIENQSFLTYKGEVNTQDGLPVSNVKIGDTYRVIENGTYAGENCRIGDLIIAVTNNPIGWIVVHSSTDPSLFLTNATGGLTVTNQTVSHSNIPITEQTTEAVYPITMDEYGHITSYGQAVDLESLVSIQPGEVDDIREISYTDPSAGYEDKYARVDHVHTITDNTITSALGYTPYDSSNPQGYTHVEGVRIGDNIATVSGGQIDITDYISTASSSVSAGSGLTSSTSGSIVTLNHSNSTTPKATQAVYPITIDSQGHIVSSGTAVDLAATTFDITYNSDTGDDADTADSAGKAIFNFNSNTSRKVDEVTQTAASTSYFGQHKLLASFTPGDDSNVTLTESVIKTPNITVQPATSSLRLHDPGDATTYLRLQPSNVMLHDSDGGHQLNASDIDKVHNLVSYSTTSSLTANVSVASGTATVLDTITFPSAGCYLVIISGYFAANANGYRSIRFTSTSSTDPLYARCETTMAGHATYENKCQLTLYFNALANTSYRIVAYQNSGSALNCKTQYVLIKMINN